MIAIFFYPALALATWIFFLAIMSLKKARDAGQLTKIAEIIAMPVLGLGYLLDFLFNVASSVLFLEFPQEWLFTARVSRHIRETGWRSVLAKWFCENLLNPFDEDHCG